MVCGIATLFQQKKPYNMQYHAKKKPLKDFRKTDSPVKIAVINFQSIREEKPLFYTFIDSNKPDIIVGTETWLTAEIHDNEIFPPELGYTVYRRDRIDKRGGGVIILVNSKFTTVLRSEFDTGVFINIHEYAN